MINFKKILFFLFLTTNFIYASVAFEKKIYNTIPLNIKFLSDKCDKIEMLLPIFKKDKLLNTTVFGSNSKFLITCDNKYNIQKINFYKNVYFYKMGLEKHSSFDNLKKMIFKNFRKHLVNITEGIHYKILEVFINKDLYQVFIFNNDKKEFEFFSLINMKNFPEYKYISKLKDKSKVPPLISWLTN